MDEDTNMLGTPNEGYDAGLCLIGIVEHGASVAVVTSSLCLSLAR